MKFKLIAGQTTKLAIVGRHFQLFSAETENVKARISSPERDYYEGEIKTAVALDFSDRADFPTPFSNIELTSDVDQTVDLWAEVVKASDNRTVLSQAGTKLAVTRPKLSITEKTEVLPESTSRVTALVQVNGEVIVDDEVNGVKINGSFNWDSQSQLFLTPASGTVEVRILEEFS